mgnify:CR=1 FL=1
MRQNFYRPKTAVKRPILYESNKNEETSERLQVSVNGTCVNGKRRTNESTTRESLSGNILEADKMMRGWGREKRKELSFREGRAARGCKKLNRCNEPRRKESRRADCCWLVGWLGRFTRLLYFLRCNCRCKRAHRPSVLYASGFRYVPLVRMTPPVLKQYRMTRDACSRSKIWFICKLPLPRATSSHRVPFQREKLVWYFSFANPVASLTKILESARFCFYPGVKPVAARVNVNIHGFFTSRLYVSLKETVGTTFLCPLHVRFE